MPWKTKTNAKPTEFFSFIIIFVPLFYKLVNDIIIKMKKEIIERIEVLIVDAKMLRDGHEWHKDADSLKAHLDNLKFILKHFKKQWGW